MLCMCKTFFTAKKCMHCQRVSEPVCVCARASPPPSIPCHRRFVGCAVMWPVAKLAQCPRTSPPLNFLSPTPHSVSQQVCHLLSLHLPHLLLLFIHTLHYGFCSAYRFMTTVLLCHHCNTLLRLRSQALLVLGGVGQEEKGRSKGS